MNSTMPMMPPRPEFCPRCGAALRPANVGRCPGCVGGDGGAASPLAAAAVRADAGRRAGAAAEAARLRRLTASGPAGFPLKPVAVTLLVATAVAAPCVVVGALGGPPVLVACGVLTWAGGFVAALIAAARRPDSPADRPAGPSAGRT